VSSSVSYRPEVDGLRAIAILAIMGNHAGVPWLTGGYLGVDIFFVVSGFVITRLVLAEQAGGTFTLAAFWRRRVRRILPALAVVLFASLAVGWFRMTPAQLADFLRVYFGALAMVPNIVLWLDVDYFTEAAATRPLLHLWSLGVEEQFYLFFPVILFLLWHRSARTRWWVLAAIALASFVCATFLLVLEPKAGFYLLPSRAWELLAGALVALSARRPGPRTSQALAALGLLMVLAPLVTFGPAGPGPETLIPVVGVVLCLLAARSGTLAGRILTASPVVLIGKGSYGTYLWHWPLLAFARIQIADEPSLAVKLALMVLALLLGLASWKWIETPFRRSRDPLLARAGILAGIALMAGLAVLGGAVALAEARGWRNPNLAGWHPDEIEPFAALRNELSGNDSCHHTTKAKPSVPFLKAWNCRGQTVGDYRAWPVALFGDSHAGNFSMVLRLTGRNPMQMTMWGCSLAPSLMRPECREAAELLRSAAREEGIETVILVNRWVLSEAKPETLVEIENYWSEVFPNLVIASPLPSYEKLDARLVHWPRERARRIPANMEVPEAFAAARKRVSGSNMQVIDGAVLFCGSRPDCAPVDGLPLMFDDKSHLTVTGARGYAERLEATGILQSLAP
jgi:peptidoglycan/LPS O-acetylase OafA/YrhL